MLKNRIFPLALALFGAIFALYPARASAQIMGDIEAHIPFPFIVRSTTLAPGKYIIRPLDEGTDRSMELVSANGRFAVLFQTISAEAEKAPQQTELVFNKHGNQEFLSKIFVAGDTDGVELEKSRMEIKLDKNGPTHKVHTLPAKQMKHRKAKLS